MPGIVIVGTQWGDEAKGKIVDILSAEHDVVVRYNGGNNAGHTVAFQGETHKLHLVPSGLFHPGVTCVIGGGVVVDPQVLLQDRIGYLWIGTQEGLARFDGVHFRVFNRRSTPPLPANNVTAVFPYSDGRLLVGMRGGGVILLAADGSIENSFHNVEGTRTFLVRSILEDRRHRIWIGTRGSGLFCLHTAVRPVMESVPEFNDNRILALMEALDGTIWVGTEGHGIALIRPEGDVKWLSRVGPSGENTIWALHEDRNGTVWAGSFGDGLIQYSLQGRQIGRLDTSDGLSSDRILSLTEDRAGNFWVGTSKGLDRIRAGKITGNSRASALEGEVILSILEDRQGNLWVGTQRSGLHRLGDSLFSVLPPTPGKALPMARVLCEDSRGTLYFGTSGQGLLRLDPEEGPSAVPESVRDFEGKDIFALCPDPAGPLEHIFYFRKGEGIFHTAGPAFTNLRVSFSP